MRLTGTAITNRTGAILVAALLLCSGQALLSGRAMPNRPAATAFRTSSATSSPARNPPTPAASRARPRRRAAALERRGRRLRPSPDDGDARSARRRRISTIASPRCGPMPHAATSSQAKLRALHRGADARSAHHGPDGFAARIHQVDLGLSRHPRERQPPRQGPRDPRQVQAAVRRDRESLWRRPLRDRGDLGHRIRITRPRWATAACCNRPRRWPASAAARPISRTSSSPRWKSSTAAICAPSRCAAPGPARSARRSSCRPRSSATPSTPTATAAATSSTIPPT